MAAMMPLQLAPVLAGVILFLVFFAIASLTTGLFVSLATLPLLYLTGYGFIPLQWTPAYGTSFRRSALLHTVIGSFVFGLATIVGIIWSGIRPEDVAVSGLVNVGTRMLSTGIILTIAFVCCVLVSAKGGTLTLTRKRASQQVLPLIGVWFGYPVLLYILLEVLGLVITGSGLVR